VHFIESRWVYNILLGPVLRVMLKDANNGHYAIYATSRENKMLSCALYASRLKKIYNSLVESTHTMLKVADVNKKHQNIPEPNNLPPLVVKLYAFMTLGHFIIR